MYTTIKINYIIYYILWLCIYTRISQVRGVVYIHRFNLLGFLISRPDFVLIGSSGFSLVPSDSSLYISRIFFTKMENFI